jgi:hypothetical protein
MSKTIIFFMLLSLLVACKSLEGDLGNPVLSALRYSITSSR